MNVPFLYLPCSHIELIDIVQFLNSQIIIQGNHTRRYMVETVAFVSAILYSDGVSIKYNWRERPSLVFSEDGGYHVSFYWCSGSELFRELLFDPTGWN